MSDDPRCCGSGTCIIDAEGICWCGQRWDGDRLVGPASACAQPAANNTSITTVDMGPVVELHNGLAKALASR